MEESLPSVLKWILYILCKLKKTLAAPHNSLRDPEAVENTRLDNRK